MTKKLYDSEGNEVGSVDYDLHDQRWEPGLALHFKALMREVLEEKAQDLRQGEFKAHQWFENRDHPKDESYGITTKGNETFLTGGEIVQELRHSAARVNDICRKCGRAFHVYGIIDRPEGGLAICPGDWILEDSNGNFSSCPPDDFGKKYELIARPKKP